MVAYEFFYHYELSTHDFTHSGLGDINPSLDHLPSLRNIQQNHSKEREVNDKKPLFHICMPLREDELYPYNFHLITMVLVNILNAN